MNAIGGMIEAGRFGIPPRAKAIAKALTVAAEIAALAWLMSTEDLSQAVLLIASFVVVAAIYTMVRAKWPFGALLMLILGSAAPRFAWTVAGLHVRPEHFTIGLLLVLIAWPSGQNHPSGRPIWRTYDRWLLLYLAVTFITSALTSPEPRLTIRWALLNALVMVPYFIIRWLTITDKSLVLVFRMLLIVGVGEAIYGIVCFFCAHLFGTTFGIELEQYGSIPGIYGTQYEANLFGSYTGACALMCLVGYMFDSSQRRRWYLWGFLIALLGALISLARAVLIAFPLVAVLVTVLAVRKGRMNLRGLTVLAGIVLAVLLLLSPLILNFVQERFSTLDVSDIQTDSTTARRLIGFSVAFSDVAEHPLLGTGANSFRLLFDWEDYWPVPETIEGLPDERGAWIGNTVVRVLHDTGVVGFIMVAGFLITLIKEMRRVIRTSSHSVRVVVIALLAGLGLYSITFQTTDATTLSFAWVHTGLLATAIAIAGRPTHGEVSVTHYTSR